MTNALPTTSEVIAAYEKTGLKPVAITTLNLNRTCGCAVGALAMANKPAYQERHMGWAWEIVASIFPVFKEKGGTYGVGFDDGFEGREFCNPYPNDGKQDAREAGFLAGRAVAAWWKAKEEVKV